MKKQKVYMVMLDYSTDDCSCIDTYLFSTYKKALKKFKEIIRQEKKPNISWVADAFDKKDNVYVDYEFETNIDENIQKAQELFWNITNKYDWYQHDFLSLKIKEVE